MSVKERILQSAEELIYQKGYDGHLHQSDIMEVADDGQGAAFIIISNLRRRLV